MCWYQPSGSSAENHASCWALEYSNSEYSNGKAYMVRPSNIGSNSKIEDFENVDASIPFGTKGSWIMSRPSTAFGTTKSASAIRFSPTVSSTSDPVIKPGLTEVVTYIASRPSQSSVTETTALFSSDVRRLQQATDNFIANNRW